MDLVQLVSAFFNDVAGQAALAVLLVGVLSFLLSVLAAFRDDVFTLSAIDAWVRSNLAGKIIPIWLFLFVGYLAKNIQFAGLPVITAIGIGAAIAYVAANLADLAAKYNPNKEAREAQDVPKD
jgi:hypothetical protein